jgi:hypothetical protein
MVSAAAAIYSQSLLLPMITPTRGVSLEAMSDPPSDWCVTEEARVIPCALVVKGAPRV